MKVLAVQDAQDARWLVPKLRERPVTNHLVAFKCLVARARRSERVFGFRTTSLLQLVLFGCFNWYAWSYFE
ncbi:unnamed protein product [Effrenium voratum]|nr:unnamed protein product [Effrenium voratum]